MRNVKPKTLNSVKLGITRPSFLIPHSSLLFSLILGALLTLAFSPFNVYSLAFLIPALLLFIWKKCSPQQAFWSGWLFGLGFFGTGASWIFISIHRFGNASTFLSTLITFVFVLILGFYFALFGFSFRKLALSARFGSEKLSDIKQCLLLYPALWVFFEFLRSVLLTGFPWLLIGYSQLSTPLNAYAPIFGIYGLSLFTIVISGAVFLLAKLPHSSRTRQRCASDTSQSSRSSHALPEDVSEAFQTKHSQLISFIVIFVIFGIGFLLENHQWTTPSGKSIEVSLIQGDIPQTIKWNANYLIQNINEYKNLTDEHWSSKIIVWPEGALPIDSSQAYSFIETLNSEAKQHNSNIIFGVPIFDKTKNVYFNGLMLIGEFRGEYLKRYLVPFGEYTPLQFLFKNAMQYFQIPMSDFSRGPFHQNPLIIDHIQLAPFICYEIAFPILVLNSAEHSNMLLTLSDDSWFSRSIALSQHFQMARMRSLETGRYQLLSTNTGITAFISPLGKIIKDAPINKKMVLTDSVFPMKGKTPLMHWHYYPVIGMVLVMLLGALVM